MIDTPSYLAVATNGALKGLDSRDADEARRKLVALMGKIAEPLVVLFVRENGGRHCRGRWATALRSWAVVCRRRARSTEGNGWQACWKGWGQA